MTWCILRILFLIFQKNIVVFDHVEFGYEFLAVPLLETNTTPMFIDNINNDNDNDNNNDNNNNDNDNNNDNN